MNRLDPIVQKIAADIERVGWSAIGVFPTESEPVEMPRFTYTVGFREHDEHPEMIVLGLGFEIAHAVLATLYERVAAGERFGDGEAVSEILRGYDARLKAVDEHPCNLARRYYDLAELPVLQVEWPDKDGHFPDDPLCRPDYALMQDITRTL